MKDSNRLSFFTFLVFTLTSNNTKYEEIYYPNHTPYISIIHLVFCSK